MTLQIPKVFLRFLPWLFFATAFESLLAVQLLLLVPSERGLSSARLALLGSLVIFFIAGIILGITAYRGLIRFDWALRTPFIFLCFFVALASSLTLFLLRYLNPERFLPFYERLSPFLWFLLIVGVQSVIFLLLAKNGFHPQEFAQRKSIYFSALIAFSFLIVIFLFIAITKLGITPDTAYWGEPGVAILGWQFIFAILAGFLTELYIITHLDTQHPFLTRYIIPIAIYLTACIFWLSVPVGVLQNSFYAPITPPGNVPFPYSDAGFYDILSQSLLIGTNYIGSIPPRPFYVTFLAVLHIFFGQRYPAIIAAQTLVLALFPVTLYFLAKKIHTPAAGVIVAMFAIFRELVGLWISSNTRVANSKIFTTDFPTALALVFLCLVLICWLERRSLKSTLAAGGFFGLVLLFRTQSLLVLPVVFILAWFVYQRKTKEWVATGIVFGSAMIFTILPWLIHNYTVIGQFAFDDPRQSAIIYSQYSFSGNLDLSQFNPETDSVGGRIISFTLENPAYVAGFIITHFLNTEIGGLLALPLIEKFVSLSAPVNLYWVAWDGNLDWYNVLLLVLYLAIIAIGLGAAWRRMGWLGLVPLAVNLGYTLANSISRFSSWRYNLPVDWVIYFYFAIGAMDFFGGLALLFGAKVNEVFPPYLRPKAKQIFLGDLRPQHVLVLLFFVFTGSLPWLAKGYAQPRYTAARTQLIAKLESNGYQGDEVNAFLSQPGAVLAEGRMLYPRLYRRNEGMSSAHPWAAYAVRDYSRIGFILLNNHRSEMIFVTKDVLDFPQGADAIVLACQGDGYFDVRVIDFGSHSYQNAPLSNPCPSSP